MSSSGSKSTGTQTSSTNLPQGVETALNTGLNDAQSLYNNNQVFAPYTGSTVIPYSQETQQAWDGIKSGYAMGGPALNSAYANIGSIANGSGMNDYQTSALTQLGNIADGSNAITTGGMYGNFANGANGITTGGLYSQIGNEANGSYSENNLKNYANGSLIGASNPAFERVLQRTQTDAQDAVQRGASAAGRYGSGIAQGNVAREVGGVTSSALANQYNQDISNQFSANSLLDSQRSGNLSTRLNAAAGLTGVQGQNLSNQLAGIAGLTGVQGQNIANRQSAAGDMFNAGQQGQQNRFTAAGMLPTLFDATLDPSRAMAGIGAQKEDLATRQKNDELRIFQEQQQQKQKSIEWLSQLAQGQGALTGGQTTTASAPRTNPFLAGASGALSGLGSTGSVGGALLGGGAGLLGSIF